MKSFKFRLNSVLEYRKQMEEEKKRELASAQRKVMGQELKIKSLKAEEEGSKTALKGILKGSFNIKEVLAQKRYIGGVEKDIAYSGAALARLKKEEDVKRLELVKAMKDKKALIKLKERKVKEYQYQSGLEDKKFLDEVAASRDRAAK